MSTEPSGWVVSERSDGTWDAVENTTSTAYQVSSAIGTRLWREDVLWPLPLHQALDRVSGPAESGDQDVMPFVDLLLAGGTVRYNTVDPAVQRWLRTGLAAAVPVRRRTADVLVRLESDAQADMLHRSCADERPGVRYRMPGDPQWHALAGHLPALPPLATPPYRGRFVALHAALLVPASGQALLVCGNQKAGKTTAALWARNAGLASVATDEVVLLDSLTGVVFGVPLPVAVRSGEQRTSVPLPQEAGTYLGAALPAAVVILLPEQEPRSPGVETAGDEEEAMSWLVEHLRDGGASPTDLHRSSRELASRVPVHRLRVSPWPGLVADLESHLSPLLKTLER
ncbi:hypothetical protein K7B10_07355 [Streptomyces flavotricini]|uniref:ATP/GTP-binding protein n=1 Tax=Streptomyces flavotricini TaxID=66888 RepID=A0ABS8E0D3_9ACTN|nr:hypothetical protein [Streptomyces flavotricini]MCC0094602.1 hypothetical protein [Streptomyces flavotricini]